MDEPYQSDWPTATVTQYTASECSKSSLWPSLSTGNGSTAQWDSSLSGRGSQPKQLSEYSHSTTSFPSSISSSSSSGSYFLPQTSAEDISSSPARSRRGNAEPGAAKKSCSHCHVTSTPLWRRDPSTQKTLCNACGLYLHQRKRLRPQELIDADIEDDTPQIPDEEYTGPKCSHCLTRQTSVWRRSKTGQRVCNACGVYKKLRGRDRPLALRRNKIKPRPQYSRD
ncbi:hypothetical protein FB451DRAFT_1033355 [Mycena latifolia]|nr:hypothetical protein FB451DRAFT_1033355 [Mycena latifolia]